LAGTVEATVDRVCYDASNGAAAVGGALGDGGIVVGELDEHEANMMLPATAEVRSKLRPINVVRTTTTAC